MKLQNLAKIVTFIISLPFCCVGPMAEIMYSITIYTIKILNITFNRSLMDMPLDL